MPTLLPRSRRSAEIFPRRIRHTVRDFYRMGEAGILDPERRYELLEGDIILTPPTGESHADRHDSLTEALVTRLAGRYRLRTQNPVRLDNYSEPLPDFAVLKLRKEGYGTAHPKPEDTLLVIELAASSLAYDIGRKQRAYAKAGIPEYWVVDLAAKQLHVFRKPAEIGYADARVLDRSEEVASTTVKGLRFTVAEIVG
jgi:Uma2 family endonuclease